MKNIEIKGTTKTPHVFFSSDKGELLIEGISIPENTVEFYYKLIYWIKEYGESPKETTTLIMKLEYFNTSTSAMLMNIFRALEGAKNTKVSVKWYYECDDLEMKDVGSDFKQMVALDFELIMVDEF